MLIFLIALGAFLAGGGFILAANFYAHKSRKHQIRRY